MVPNETTGELLVRITNTIVIIKESYAAYENKGRGTCSRQTSWMLQPLNGKMMP
jgi:hypothetical protein